MADVLQRSFIGAGQGAELGRTLKLSASDDAGTK
jgi:hypothetical protein